MKHEFLKMQKLAGIITESQYQSKLNEEETVSPEEAAQKAPEIADKFETSPVTDKIAMDIAKDPKVTKQLMDLLNKYGINPANLNENVDDVAQKLALIFAKKADKETISEESNYGSAFFTGLLGGGTLAHYLFRQETYDLIGRVQHSAAMGETMAGAILGALLAVVGVKVYNMIKNK